MLVIWTTASRHLLCMDYWLRWPGFDATSNGMGGQGMEQQWLETVVWTVRWNAHVDSLTGSAGRNGGYQSGACVTCHRVSHSMHDYHPHCAGTLE